MPLLISFHITSCDSEYAVEVAAKLTRLQVIKINVIPVLSIVSPSPLSLKRPSSPNTGAKPSVFVVDLISPGNRFKQEPCP
jgi:hypothetical protein